MNKLLLAGIMSLSFAQAFAMESKAEHQVGAEDRAQLESKRSHLAKLEAQNSQTQREIAAKREELARHESAAIVRHKETVMAPEEAAA